VRLPERKEELSPILPKNLVEEYSNSCLDIYHRTVGKGGWISSYILVQRSQIVRHWNSGRSILLDALSG
jgi:hypothetical protein